MWFIIALAILGVQPSSAQTTAGQSMEPASYGTEGACKGGDECCTTSNQCGAGEGDCDSDDQCLGDLTCGKDNCNREGFPSFDSTDDCCQRGECPTVCTKEYKPVCCSNGMTLNNMCEFKKANCLSYQPMTIAHEGPCCNPVCPAIFAPVCGSDGKTYDNDCALDFATCKSGGDVTKLHDRQCKNFCGDPFCDQTCVTGEICEATDYKCVQEPCCLAFRCVEECPETCPDYDDPICGSDGKTYFCHCNLRMANCGLTEKITKVHNGACEGYEYPANITEAAVKRCTGGDSCCSVDYDDDGSMDEACGLGEGDCDTDADCMKGLVCGTDNCKGTGFDSTDDCCMLPDGGLEPPKGEERIIYTLPGKDPLSAFGMWPTQAVQLDNVIYFSAVLGVNQTTGLMVEGVRLQARQMFDNLKALLKLMDIDMTRGVKATLYVTNLDYHEVALKVWLEECNWKEYPALTTVQVSGLPRGALMQLDGIAACNDCNTKFYVIGRDSSPSTRRGGYGGGYER